MSGFGLTEAPEFVFRKELGDGDGAILMNPVGSPGGDDHLTTGCGIEEGLVILGSVGIAGADHLFRVGGAEAEDIGHQKTVEALAFGKSADTRQRGIEFLFIRRARVEPDPHNQAITEQGVDPVQQGVAMLPVGRKMADVFQGLIG